MTFTAPNVSDAANASAPTKTDRYRDSLPSGKAKRDRAFQVLNDLAAGPPSPPPPSSSGARLRLRRALSTSGLNELLHAEGLPSSMTLTSVVSSTVERLATFVLPPSPPPPPPSPPPSPPPPSPPSPPSPPPGVCVDTCNTNAGGIVGECNDGGPGDLKKNVACDYGSDCSDCGVRIFCVECSEQCQADAVQHLVSKEPEKACMHEQWGDAAWAKCPFGSPRARLRRLLRARLVAPCSSALPGWALASGIPATASTARASRLQSRRSHRL